MGDNINTTARVNARAAAYLTRELLEVADYRDVYGPMGVLPKQRKDMVPLRSSKTAQWRRFEHLPKVSTPLAEGVTPDGVQVTVTDLTADLVQYGSYVMLSDITLDVVEDPQIVIWGERQGDQAVRSINTIREGVLLGGTSVAYTEGTSRAEVGTLLGATIIAKTERALSLNIARKLTTLISPTNGYSTTPIPGAFFAITHTYIKYDVENTIGATNGFVPVQKYPTQSGVAAGEYGAINRVRFLEHEEMTYFADSGKAITSGHKSTSAANDDVFATLIVAEGAYGITPFGGYKGRGKKMDGIEGIIKEKGSAGTGDPLNQRASVGWKLMEATKRLNETWMYRIESAATA